MTQCSLHSDTNVPFFEFLLAQRSQRRKVHRLRETLCTTRHATGCSTRQTENRFWKDHLAMCSPAFNKGPRVQRQNDHTPGTRTHRSRCVRRRRRMASSNSTVLPLPVGELTTMLPSAERRQSAVMDWSDQTTASFARLQRTRQKQLVEQERLYDI
jgi:hypothetical protein